MKKTFKLCALLVAAAAAIAVTFTGCPDLGFGKDDLFGTWMTLDFDSNEEPVSYYTPSGSTDKYSVTWKFDGKSENMFARTGGTFKQHLIKYNSSMTSISEETFWYGEYAVKGNSGYSKGKLYLYYECGYDMKKGSASLDKLWDWTLDDFISVSGYSGIDNFTEEPSDDNGIKFYRSSTSNPVLLQIKEVDGNVKCSDIEYFRFNLKDGSLYGYTRLMSSTKDPSGALIGGVFSQWATAAASGVTNPDKRYDGGYKVKDGCSWRNVDTRYMGRISARSTPDDPIWMYSVTKSNSEYFQGVDDGDDNNYADPEVDMRPEQ